MAKLHSSAARAGILGLIRTRSINTTPNNNRNSEPESGSAMIEFIFLVTLLLVPLIYLVIAAGALQSATYAAVGAADHGAKVFVSAESEGQASARVADAVHRAAANMGIDGARTSFSYSCSGTCLSPGSTVTVRVSIDTVLPLLPADWSPRTGRVKSSATHRIDRYG